MDTSVSLVNCELSTLLPAIRAEAVEEVVERVARRMGSTPDVITAAQYLAADALTAHNNTASRAIEIGVRYAAENTPAATH